MLDRVASLFSSFKNYMGKPKERLYADYYHYVVAQTPTNPTLSDQLIIRAFEATSDPEYGLCSQMDVKTQCARAYPFYQLAKIRTIISLRY